ncbi:MAG: diadenylate cyclase CdaA [Phycisphaerae bacterium]
MHAAVTLGQTDPADQIRSLVDQLVDRPVVALTELLLIGAVVYGVLRFLHGTRGAGLVRAVVIILAISFAVFRLVAHSLGLERINVLYPYFVLGVFLVSLVAFQTELRRILMRLGEGAWLRKWTKAGNPMIDPIVAAVERLSKKKIGALIAVERNTEVGALVESGVALDAEVSTELLETIFWPGTPLHDLGVIMRAGRVVAAGCQFPLADSMEVDRALGSRHRAAVGMSHDSDAVVIIVSEETGVVSVAVQGRLRRSLTPQTLRETLVKALAVDRPGEKKTKTAPAVPAPEPAAGRA